MEDPSGRSAPRPRETQEKQLNTREKAAEELLSPVLGSLISSKITALTTTYNSVTAISRNL
jgi:hypothetical protein